MFLWLKCRCVQARISHHIEVYSSVSHYSTISNDHHLSTYQYKSVYPIVPSYSMISFTIKKKTSPGGHPHIIAPTSRSRPSASATVGDRLGGDERPMDVHRHRAGANVACFSSGNRAMDGRRKGRASITKRNPLGIRKQKSTFPSFWQIQDWWYIVQKNDHNTWYILVDGFKPYLCSTLFEI